jgi:Family of unknown function (DUF6350)
VTTSARRARLGAPQAGQTGTPASRELVAAGAVAGCAAAGVGLAVITILAVIGWIAAPHSGLNLGGVLRTAAVLWLVAHHVTVTVRGAGQIGMLPLGLVALPGALLWRAGRSVVRSHQVTELSGAVTAVLAIALPYGAVATTLAVVSRTRLAEASVPQALAAGLIVAVVASGLGAARALTPRGQAGGLLAARTRSVLTGTAGSLCVLAACGSAATAIALATDVHKFSAVYRLLDPGVVGSGLLLLAQIAYLPNAVLWAVAYMLGPGFAVGAGTVVAPAGSAVGLVPAFPLLAALPSAHTSGPGWLASVMLAVPYVAGAVGGLLVARAAPTQVLEAAPIRGFCAGLLAGGVLGVATAFAGGPLGDGRMAAVGPSPWQVALVAVMEVGIAAAITAGAANWWHLRTHWDGGPGSPSVKHEAAYRAAAAAPASAWAGRGRGDQDDGHVIYLDRWAADQDETARMHPGADPSALP